jgi:hypothetical protein
MSIIANDRRTPPAPMRTGTPAPPETSTDTVLVRPLRSFMEGSAIVNRHTPPFPLPRHHAEGLRASGLVSFDDPKPAPVEAPVDPLKPVDPVVPPVEPEVEQPDDQSRRAPDQSQVTASTVPARPGAEPVRPDAGVVPPAATTELPKRARRGRRTKTAV